MTPAERKTALFDLLVANPEGVTLVEIKDAIESADYKTTRTTIRDVRLMFGEDDTINLVCDPHADGPWLYRLVGTMAESESWAKYRLRDTIARLETMSAVVSSIERGLDGRSTEGRQARIIRRSIDRAREDIAELQGVIEL